MGITVKLHFKQNSSEAIEGLSIGGIEPQMEHIILIHLEDAYRDSPLNHTTSVDAARQAFWAEFREMVELVVRQLHAANPNHAPKVENLREIIRSHTAILLTKHTNTGFSINSNLSVQRMEFNGGEIDTLSFSGLGPETVIELGAPQPHELFFRKKNPQVIFMKGIQDKYSVIEGIQKFGAVPANTAFIFSSNSDHHKREQAGKLPVIGNKKLNPSAITVTRNNSGIAILAFALQEDAGFQIGGIPSTKIDRHENPVHLVLATMEQIDAWLKDPKHYIILPVRDHKDQKYFTKDCFNNLEPSWFGGVNMNTDPVTTFLLRLYFMEKAGLTISPLEQQQRELLKRINGYQIRGMEESNKQIVNAADGQALEAIKSGLRQPIAALEDDWVTVLEDKGFVNTSGGNSLSSSSFGPLNLPMPANRGNGVMPGLSGYNSGFFSHNGESSSASGPSNLPMPVNPDNAVTPVRYICSGCKPEEYEAKILQENDIVYYADNLTHMIYYKYRVNGNKVASSISADVLGVDDVTRRYALEIKEKLAAKVNANPWDFSELNALKNYIKDRPGKKLSLFDTFRGDVDTRIRVAKAIVKHVELGNSLNEIRPEDRYVLGQFGSELPTIIENLGTALGRNFVAEVDPLHAERNQRMRN